MGRLLTAIEGANKACHALTDSPTQYPPTHQLRMELLPDVLPRSDVQQAGIGRQGRVVRCVGEELNGKHSNGVRPMYD